MRPLELRATDSYELSKHQYRQVMAGVYAAPDVGKVLFVDHRDRATLIVTGNVDKTQDQKEA